MKPDVLDAHIWFAKTGGNGESGDMPGTCNECGHLWRALCGMQRMIMWSTRKQFAANPNSTVATVANDLTRPGQASRVILIKQSRNGSQSIDNATNGGCATPATSGCHKYLVQSSKVADNLPKARDSSRETDRRQADKLPARIGRRREREGD